jgi:chemotaxis protein methyltransferase CheR
VSIEALERIADLVRAESGFGLSDRRLEPLSAALARVRPGLDAAAFLQELQGGSGGRVLLASLVDEITVNETYFFRERGQIDGIPWLELRDVAQARGASKIRVWSAACSTGEEAYTLAMSAYDAFHPLTPPLEIIATDIAPSVLIRARGARYRERSVREVDERLRGRWLIRSGAEWEVAPELRALVIFSRHNLIHDTTLPGTGEPFDLIVCRNVLIYFDAPTSQRVVAILRRSLQPNGRLLLGSADALGETSRALAAITTAPPPNGRSRRTEPSASARVRRTAAAPEPEASGELDANACFVQGIADLERGAAGEAIAKFKRALWLDGGFGLAAFALGRAHDLLGDRAAAALAYRRALRTLGSPETVSNRDAHETSMRDVAAACQARLVELQV